MQSLQVPTLVVAGLSLIVAIGSLFLVYSTRKAVVHSGSSRIQPDHDTTTQPCHDGDRAEQRKDLDVLRLQHALWIVLAGIVTVLVAFIVVLFRLSHDRTTLGTLFGTVTAAVGTLVGLIAGHAAGSAGKDRTEERNRQALEERNREL